MQLAGSDAQRLLPRHAVKVCARSQQRAVAAAPHIVHDAPRLPLDTIQACRPAIFQRLEQPLDLFGPATAGCQ